MRAAIVPPDPTNHDWSQERYDDMLHAELERLRSALAEVWRRFPEDHANLDLISDEVADLAESVMRAAQNGRSTDG